MTDEWFMNKCEFAGCDDEGTLVRQSESNGEMYRYCPDHDPLANGGSEGFSEVSADE